MSDEPREDEAPDKERTALEWGRRLEAQHQDFVRRVREIERQRREEE